MHRVLLLGSQKTYRVGKILCVTRNYRAHAAELNNEPPEQPVFFLKPSSSIIGQGETAVIPPCSQNCQHEVELAVLIGKWGKNIPPETAISHVAGYGIAIDLTLRDLQQDLKAKGLPWSMAKGFDTSCPLTDFLPASQVPDPQALDLSLYVNDELRQQGNSSEMIHSIPNLISAASALFSLEEGDILLTGTPAGVGRLISGDLLKAQISQIGTLTINIR
ncbi:acylpyruvase [Syntrophotalea acetylenivorans]|uniref:Acylpyruvase n=1 Tax=Syntrophotalea acetylenivorans TaxID=1842532 RepID=A0A1L3GPN7_9BACT|nr:fumarylacetoacetate hydrolase family protein [Syntrophotalea acetylenivorans]APG27899.1 acylpyruvase [Syntrophotalea acetylenivorans]